MYTQMTMYAMKNRLNLNRFTRKSKKNKIKNHWFIRDDNEVDEKPNEPKWCTRNVVNESVIFQMYIKMEM